METTSKIFGNLALVFMITGLIPFLGIFNYLAIILAIPGMVFGAISEKPFALNLNGIVLIVSLIRLWLGGLII